MNRTTGSNDHHLNDQGGYQAKQHRPWLPVALVAGAVALAVGGYAVFDGSRVREGIGGDARGYRGGASGQTVERGSQSSGSAYGVGTPEALRQQGASGTGAYVPPAEGAHHGTGTIDQRGMDQGAMDPGATGPGPTSPTGAPSANDTTF